jgi:hypothetical protein
VTPIPLFVELCAGTAALSLRLHRDGAKPPVSRMGSKSGYADAILRILGLRPGQRAAAYLWCEPDPGVRLLLHAYRSAPLARAAAAIIRGWAAEDPRALWERLRAEGPPKLPEGEVDAGEVARAVITGQWAYRRGSPESGFAEARTGSGSGEGHGDTADMLASRWAAAPVMPEATITPDARHIDPREVARWAQITASNRLINTAWSDTEGRWINTGDGGATFGGAAFCSPPERTAEGMEAAPGDVPAVVVPDAREVDPREVARWAIGQKWTQPGREPFAAFNDVVALGRAFTDRRGASGVWVPQTPDKIGARFDAAPGDVPALIHPDARDIDPPALPPGTVAYMDGPYENTTQYANLLPRAEQVTIARRWAAAGATVAISEAEAIPELVAEGWHAVRIDGERVGQKRTFSKQQEEWVTLNRPPAWVPPTQGRLF